MGLERRQAGIQKTGFLKSAESPTSSHAAKLPFRSASGKLQMPFLWITGVKILLMPSPAVEIYLDMNVE